MMPIRRRPWLALPAVWLALSVFPQASDAKDWRIPSVCTNGVTGDDDDDPPIVTVVANTKSSQSSLSVGNVQFTQGGGEALVIVPEIAWDNLFVYVSFTPFLDGYVGYAAGQFTPGLTQPIRLPNPGDPNTARRVVYRGLLLTVQYNGQTYPNANVQFEPDFLGGDPYTIQADGNAQIPINCFMTRPGGNPVYVVPQSSASGFDAAVAVTGQQQGIAIGTLQARQQQ